MGRTASSVWTGFYRTVGMRARSGPLLPLIGLLAVVGLGVPPAAALAQEGAIRGSVVAAGTLRPLPGAQILVSGTEIGTVADARGRFELTDVPGTEVTLEVTHLGYRPEERTVRVGASDIRIALEVSAIELDEIVVTGAPPGVQARSLGNALANIDAEEVVETAPVQTVSELLNARAPGVVLQAQQGTAGGGNRILIRGRSSLQFAGDPLIYVDGVRVNNDFTTGPLTPEAGAPVVISRLDDIDPNDIESIEIIKGPAAATLYGTEASAGVVQIITKKGRAGATRVDARVRQGINTLLDEGEVVGTQFGVDESGQVFEFDPLRVLREERGFDYFRDGHVQGYGLSVTGGEGDVQYYVSGDWDREEGIVPSNTSSKFRGRTNLSFQPVENLTLDASLGITTGRVDTYHYLYFFSGRYANPALAATPFDGFTGTPPDVQDATQEVFQEFDHFTGGVQLNHRPAEWFTQRLNVGLDLTNEENTWLIPFVPDEFAVFYSGASRLGQKQVNGVESEQQTVDYAGTFTFPLLESLTTNTSVGLQYYRRLAETQLLEGEQFPAPGVSSITGIAGPRNVADDFVESVTVGLYVQQQFGWQDRLFLTAALRADDHSAFGGEFDVVTYPKVSASWVLSEEPFWDVGWANTLRVRAAYGESGQQPDAFAAIRTYEPVAGEGDVPTGSVQFIGNPELGPERGREIEVGLDAGLFDDRLGLDITYYSQRTEDAIVSRQVAPSTGFPQTQFVNAGEIRNEGVELLLTTRPLDTPNVDWDLTFNFSKNSNEVVSIDVPGDAIAVGFIPNFHRPGFPAASFFGKRVVSAELDAEGTATNVLCDDGAGGAVPCAGAPDVFLGQNVPDTEGSISTTVTLFERLRLGALADFKLGRSYFNSDKAILCSVFRVHEINFFPERFDPADVAYCEGAAGVGFFDGPGIEDADWAKLREVSLSYSIPEDLAARFGASRAGITVAARNVLTRIFDETPFHTTDPEVFTAVNYTSSNHNQGIVPLPLQFMTTVYVTF